MTDENREPEFEELEASADDAIIGKAFKASVAVIGLVALIFGVAVFLNRDVDEPVEQVTQIADAIVVEVPEIEAPRVSFSEITAEAGIRFERVNGASGDKFLPETMGGGGGFFDFDGDLDQDLLLVNGRNWDEGDSKEPGAVLFVNNGKGEFSEPARPTGLEDALQGMGVAFGDYDGDGAVDIYLTAVGANRLLRNVASETSEGPLFLDVTTTLKVGGSAADWSTGATWLDYDRDGDLDLFVCNYVRWSKEIDFALDYTLVGVGRAYGPPKNYQGSFPVLYRNDGDQGFRDVSEESGIQIRNKATDAPVAKSMAVIPVDLNEDGWTDLVVANDTVQNFVFVNQGDGTFKESGAMSGIAFDRSGFARGAMGIDATEMRKNGSLTIGIGNFANEMTALYMSDGKSIYFTDEAISEGIGVPSRASLTFGLFFFDYDLDGREDLLAVNGHLEEEINTVQPSQHYRQPVQLFWNAGEEGDFGFIHVDEEKVGSALLEPIVGRGSAFADIDLDGDLDVLLMQPTGSPKLFRNDQQLNQNWVAFDLRGRLPNVFAMGALVRLKVGGRTLVRSVNPTKSYLSQSQLMLTFGLGEETDIGPLEIQWPDGTGQIIEAIEINQRTTIQQAE